MGASVLSGGKASGQSIESAVEMVSRPALCRTGHRAWPSPTAFEPTEYLDTDLTPPHPCRTGATPTASPRFNDRSTAIVCGNEFSCDLTEQGLINR